MKKKRLEYMAGFKLRQCVYIYIYVSNFLGGVSFFFEGVGDLHLFGKREILFS